MVMHGTFNYVPMDKVVFGRPAADVVLKEAQRLGAQRVFLLVSRTLNRETEVISTIRTALGERFAGEFEGIPPHTPREAVVEAAAAARMVSADLIVTVGGGSVTDAGKVMQICLKHGVTTPEGLDAYHVQFKEDGTPFMPEFAGPDVRQLTVPTTLSGGEFYPLAGCTDSKKKVKEGYRHNLLVPRVVIFDPELTVHTPEWLWLSTGIRAVDHAVEALCSAYANPICDGAAMQALRLLSAGLPQVKANPLDMDARLTCQLGVLNSMVPIQGGVPMGASHAIGHILGGTCDVPHGYTSCVMLPNVLRFNAPVNGERQALVSEAFGRAGEAAADVVGEFIAALGMPRTLRDVSVTPDLFDLIAKNSLHDRWLHTNPRKIDGAADVVKILEMAA